ncbi:calmodulin-like [Rhipicephalus sanguineus]|uniref:calmodulin-like n=1 Tax=Rhipicephalus sanguineus TaxID=34632 RepID=UPI0018949737|nr:calmodulin-like [Rhipicephalus sanguineus]
MQSPQEFRRSIKNLLDAHASTRTSNGAAPEPSRRDVAVGTDGSEEFSEEELAKLRREFEWYDKDGDGQITAEDLGAMMSVLGFNLTQEELEMEIAEVDRMDGDGMINFSEFVAKNAGDITLPDITPRDSTPTAEEIRVIFQLIDRHGNGFLTLDELRRFFAAFDEEGLTDEEIEEFTREADTDGDGKISYDEFVALMTSM